MSRRLSLVSTQNMKSEQKNEKTKPLSFMFVPCLASRPGLVLQFIVYSIDSPDSFEPDPELASNKLFHLVISKPRSMIDPAPCVSSPVVVQV